MKRYLYFWKRCLKIAFVGDWRYYGWLGILLIIILGGVNAYAKQYLLGLGTTGMSDQVSWGVYIANFTFLVGMAAAAVMLVIPVYIYKNEELHDLVIFGELLAVAAILMCLAFVTVDLGRPDRFWHLIPGIGIFHFPGSMLSWDVLVLNGYLLINLHICGYHIYCRYCGRKPSNWLSIPVVFLGILWAVSIHTITAFLYVGLGGRHFWNSAVLGPRFIASAFTAGPAFIILTLQIIRQFSDYHVPDRALFTLRSIVQIAMPINMFLLINELFTEFYTTDRNSASSHYLFLGLHGHHALVPWIWTAIGLNITSMILLMLPLSRRLKWLDTACILAVIGIWIEKGMGMVVPGFVPTPIGEIVEYTPSKNEVLICLGIWAFGFFCYTIFLRMAVPILQGKLSRANEPAKANLT